MKKYKILAEYYNDDKFICYIVQLEDGRIAQMKKETLERYCNE